MWEAITDCANILDHEIDCLFYALPILLGPRQDQSPSSAGTPRGDHGKSFLEGIYTFTQPD